MTRHGFNKIMRLIKSYGDARYYSNNYEEIERENFEIIADLIYYKLTDLIEYLGDVEKLEEEEEV